MELKEYIKIFKNNYKWFLYTIVIVLAVGLLIQFLLGDRYKVELDLNITRTGYQKDTSEYRYDEFYRLQADERFADTVVQWVSSDRTKKDILDKSNNTAFTKLKAKRLSSQMIKLSFLVKDKNQSEKLTASIAKILNEKSNDLNLEQKNPNWFKILVSQPVVNEYKIPWIKLAIILLFGGIFFGFWVVLIRHYLE